MMYFFYNGAILILQISFLVTQLKYLIILDEVDVDNKNETIRVNKILTNIYF